VRGTAAIALAIVLFLLASLPQAQGTAPATPLTLLSREGRRPVPTIVLSGQELVALDDVAALFQVAVREDTLAGGLTITYRGQTIVMSSEQPMASVSGRVVALPSPAVRSGNRWFVPLDFLPRALGPIYGSRIDLRRPSRLLVVGDLRVPRVTARVDIPGPPTRATVEIAPAAPVVATTEPGRVVLRIDADALDLTLPAAGGGLIDAIRTGDQPSTVAIVLNERSGPARTVLADANGNTRITIEVPGIAPPPGDTTAAPPAAAPPAPGIAPPAPGIAAPPPVFSTSRAAVQTIVIDPGHGGDDVGVRGARGVQEKMVTLEVARRLRTLVEMRLGIRVVLTRDEDRTVTLDERAAVANNSKADLFLSLHLNAAPVAAVAGAEVFYLRLDREGEDARRAAESEEVPLPVLGGTMRSIDVIQWDLAQARHVEASAALAGILEQSLRAQIMMSPRPRQDGPLRVLTGVNMPAALIEMAYLSNANQERLVQSEAFQSSVVQALYNAIVGFRSYLEDQPTP
jgi:N-acetylmuramoyl-L-alanine amidase